MRSTYSEMRNKFTAALCAVLFVAAFVGLPLVSTLVHQYNLRVQAVERARSMDGNTYLLTPTGWTWLGDTIMRVEDEQGEYKGWIAMHDTNPLTPEMNVLYLHFSDKRDDPLPTRVKVRALYRAQPWALKNIDGQDEARENYTGDFLEFRKLDSGREVAASGN